MPSIYAIKATLNAGGIFTSINGFLFAVGWYLGNNFLQHKVAANKNWKKGNKYTNLIPISPHLVFFNLQSPNLFPGFIIPRELSR